MPYSVTAPAEKGFGQEQDAYLASLLKGSPGDPTADAIGRLILMHQASRNDPEAYQKAYLAYLNNQHAGAVAENQKDAAVAYLGALPNLAQRGISRGVSIGDNPYVGTNNTVLSTADAEALNALRAEDVKNVGEGVKNLGAANVRPSAGYLAGILSPAGQAMPEPVDTSFVSAEDKAKQETADAAKLSSEAAMYRAKVNHEGANGSKDTISFVSDGKGGWVPIMRTEVTKGGASGTDPNHVEKRVPKHIIDPKTGLTIPNPAYKGP